MASNTEHAEFVTTVASEGFIKSKESTMQVSARESITTRPIKSD
jgi:hypothetical protein